VNFLDHIRAWAYNNIYNMRDKQSASRAPFPSFLKIIILVDLFRQWKYLIKIIKKEKGDQRFPGLGSRVRLHIQEGELDNEKGLRLLVYCSPREEEKAPVLYFGKGSRGNKEKRDRYKERSESKGHRGVILGACDSRQASKTKATIP
jgi:hypothetical protein